MTSDTKPGNVVLPAARACYVHVFKPAKGIGKDAPLAYRVTLLFPKEQSDLSAAKKAILAAARAKFGANALEGLRTGRLKNPLRDGDDPKLTDPLFKGHWFISARRKEEFGPPGVVDQRVRPITKETDFYSGVWCYASVSFFGFSVDASRGVAAGLNNLQKIRDDERLSGSRPPEADFSPLETEGGEDIDDDFPF